MKKIIAADLFCGAGGSSTGLARAALRLGRRLDLVAVNHWPTAVETHAANHPEARHLCESLDSTDPRKVAKRLDLLVASPECTHHSIARGGKPMNDQSRSTAWHVVRWAEALRPTAILVENVREWQSWGPIGTSGRPMKSRKGETFEAWLGALRSLGYTVGHGVLNAADYGGATTRERLFVVAVRGRRPVPWPEPSHARDGGDRLFGAALPRWRAAREVIDWSLPGESIFSRKRPLKPNTLRRIEAGLRKFGGIEFVLHTTHAGGDRVNGLADPLPTVRGTRDNQIPYTAKPATDPLGTISANGTHHGLVESFLMSMSQTGSNGDRLRSAGRPLPTVTTADDTAVVQPFLIPTNYGERPGQTPRTHDLDSPVPTVVGTVAHGLVQPFVIGQQSGATPRLASRPLPTVATDGAISLIQPFLVSYYGNGQPLSVEDPLDTVTARDRFALVTVNGKPALLDVRFRMLQPHELAAAMGFPRDYRFAGNRGDVVKQIGNAVSVEQADALCSAILEAVA